MKEKVLEQVLLGRWRDAFALSPLQLNRAQDADAELIDIGGDDLLALTVDAISEEIATGLYTSATSVGYVGVMASLSDLAATGAEPLGLLLWVSLPENDLEKIQSELSVGVSDACARADTFVLGGDTSIGPLSMACTAVGRVPRKFAVTRKGARPGDIVYSTAPLGLGAVYAGSKLLHLPVAASFMWQPVARLREGLALRGLLSSCMDTSDGLITTLHELATLNHVRISLEGPCDRLLAPEAADMARVTRLPSLAFAAAMHGEYELVFTVNEAHAEDAVRSLRAIGCSALRLGTVEKGEGAFLDDREIDSASIRNLNMAFDDPQHYIDVLSKICRGYP